MKGILFGTIRSRSFLIVFYRPFAYKQRRLFCIWNDLGLSSPTLAAKDTAGNVSLLSFGWVAMSCPSASQKHRAVSNVTDENTQSPEHGRLWWLFFGDDMRLVSCKECKHQISKSAKVCPNCGYQKSKISVTRIFFLCFLVLIIYSAYTMEPAPPLPKTQLTPEQQASEDRFQKVSFIGSALITNLHDPNSVEWLFIGSDEKADLVCFEYRAKNGFGALRLEKTAILNGKEASWDKNCAKANLYDTTHARQNIRELR